jgi:cellulose synthase (UDP-forming)
LTFNGLIDRKGRYKNEYFRLMNALQDSVIEVDNSVIRILRPAALIYENRTYQYYAMIYNDIIGWKHGVQVDGYKFEWSLVKCDKFGNFLAVKDVGIGAVLSLTIPQNHEYFKLLLTASNGMSVTKTISSLNTPLVQK